MTRPALIVDRDDDTRRILGAFLPRMGLEPLEAIDGATALEIARGHDLALVITDLYLPAGDARCLVQLLKRDRDLASIPLLVYTAHCTDADVEWAATCGCDGFLAKPARWAELEPAIIRLLDHRRVS